MLLVPEFRNLLGEAQYYFEGFKGTKLHNQRQSIKQIRDVANWEKRAAPPLRTAHFSRKDRTNRASSPRVVSFGKAENCPH